MKRVLLSLIASYRGTISQVRPHYCRFVPSCSEYTYESVERYGVVRGVWAGFKRLMRCHPFSEGGYDPVP
ncbi:MAG: membrane protein insertion efficiency factor YidD [Chloroflexota bacterium]|nr:membrane protein insertion efficiency factor YidD [Chloroflexota bacterium]